MLQEKPEYHDGSQEKWTLGDSSAESGVFRETGSSPTPLEASVAASSALLHTVLWSLPYSAAGSWARKCFSVPASCFAAEPSTLLGMEEMSNKYL